jgi:hypothetical protein
MYQIPDKNTFSSLCSLIRDYCSTKTLALCRQHRDPLWIANCPPCGDLCPVWVFVLPANNWYQS